MAMKFYTNSEQAVYALDDEQYFSFLPSGCREITEQEFEEIKDKRIHHDFVDGEWIWNDGRHKKEKCDAVMSILSEKLNSGYYHLGKIFQIDPIAQDAITKQDAYATKSEKNINKYPWDDDHNTWESLENESVYFATPQEFQDFSQIIFNHCNLLYIVARNHKKTIRGMESFEDVKNFNIESGWTR